MSNRHPIREAVNLVKYKATGGVLEVTTEKDTSARQCPVCCVWMKVDDGSQMFRNYVLVCRGWKLEWELRTRELVEELRVNEVIARVCEERA